MEKTPQEIWLFQKIVVPLQPISSEVTIRLIR
jgi:hypothetical protein